MFTEPKNQEFSSEKMQKAMRPFLSNMQKAYHSELSDTEHVIDKRRQWQSIENIEMFIDIYGFKPKIICPVAVRVLSAHMLYQNTFDHALYL